MSAHTPGPWKYDPLEVGGFNIVPKDDPSFKICRIANAITYLMDFDERAEPDARLIAAAPDMLAALTLIRDYYEREFREGDKAYQAAAIARSVITAATGVA